MYRLRIEKGIFRSGYRLIGGIDEAGRGPLAGPVVAACLAIKPGFKIKNKSLRGVKDSKLLSEKEREKFYGLLIAEDLEIGIGLCSHKIIDKINIFQASFYAMRKAIANLDSRPDFIVVDGKFPIEECPIKQKAIVKGDQKVFLIAAASIIAKVTRDRIMGEMHKKYPAYGFNRHKGYATVFHRKNILAYGRCPIHRLSFSVKS